MRKTLVLTDLRSYEQKYRDFVASRNVTLEIENDADKTQFVYRITGDEHALYEAISDLGYDHEDLDDSVSIVEAR